MVQRLLQLIILLLRVAAAGIMVVAAVGRLFQEVLLLTLGLTL
jgi:hypothetical protein